MKYYHHITFYETIECDELGQFELEENGCSVILDAYGKIDYCIVENATILEQDFSFTKHIKHVTKHENQDWLLLNRKTFQPIIVAPFYIVQEGDTSSVPEGMKALFINASTAFGTGHHATTQLCIQLLNMLYEKNFSPMHVADIGTGTLILSLVAHHFWPNSTFIASDNDDEALKRAKENKSINHGHSINIIHAQGLENENFLSSQYDLIMANILLSPLCDIASSMGYCVRDHGYVILSGILQTQEDVLLKCYRKEGFDVVSIVKKDEWSAVLLKKITKIDVSSQ